jgi:anti-sigma B factor antagonist
VGVSAGSIVEQPTAPQLVLSGEIDVAVAAELRAAGARVVEALDADARLEIDLGAVTFIDSSGVGALVAIRNLADARRLPLALAHPSPKFVRFLELTGLREHFTLLPEPI